MDRIYIDCHEFIIGREKSGTNYIISQPCISKKHAVIKKQNNEFYIFDLDSSNGTYVNSFKLEPNREYKLKNEDSITFGNQNYKFFDK